MPQNGELWTGDEWEKYSQALLKQHYPPGDYQEVPADHVGDFGIDGFSTDGVVYQCYCAEEPLASDERYEKQRDKLTADTGKFIAKHVEIAEMLGRIRVRRWIFLVPYFDSARLVQHGQRKAADIRAASLGYVDSDFEITIVTDDYFPRARAELAAHGVSLIRLGPAEIAAPEVDSWITANSQLLDTLLQKVGRIPTLQLTGDRDGYARKLVTAYLEGEAVLSRLQNDYPQAHIRVLELKAARERTIEFASAASIRPGGEILTENLTELQRDMRSAVPALSEVALSTLGVHAIADWLMRCPLQIPEFRPV